MNSSTTNNDTTSLETTKTTPPPPPLLAQLVPPSSLVACAARLRAGGLVAFPTETVYGLGCHALNHEACLSVFRAKRRPRTDPLIVHVLDAPAALELWEKDSDGILAHLATRFFPGPLTLVARVKKASSSGGSTTTIVPEAVTAGTGYVACRSPSHPLARRLLELTGRGAPLAAPSANRFGHVSPTRAAHVLDDLGQEDVWVIEEEDEGCDEDHHNQHQKVGVESTVAKVDQDAKVVSLLRQGAVSAQDIRDSLIEAGLDQVYTVDVRVKTTSEQVANVAPGQTIKHYSPYVTSFMLSTNRQQQQQQQQQPPLPLSSSSSPLLSTEETVLLAQAVVLDFGGRLRYLQPEPNRTTGSSTGCLAYRDLSARGDSQEAAARVFEYLRWAETVPGAQRVYFPELVVDETATVTTDTYTPVVVDALTLALKDRLTRAASGVVVDVLR